MALGARRKDNNELVMPRKPMWKRLSTWLSLLGLIVLLGGAGAGWWYFAGQQPQAPAVAEVADNQALYVGVSKPFIFSVRGDNRDRLVQVEVELLVRGEADEAEAKRHLPLLESTLLTVLSSHTAASFLTADNKNVVREEARDALNLALTDVVGRALVERVLFTSVVVQ